MDSTGLPESTIKRASSTKRRSPSADRKRQLIIESAERIFATRGFHDTTIADISNDSEVHEASIFQYFKTKENLIVTVPERHLKETLAGITEHLQGMKGAEPKIRKLLWHQLRDLSVNKNYTSILLRELRTLPAFYQSPAYEMIRKYSAFAVEAIREGIRDHEVDPQAEVILVLEMIFGAIDSIVLRWLFFGDPYDPNEAADALCSLIKAAIWKRDEPAIRENGDEPTRGELRRRSYSGSRLGSVRQKRLRRCHHLRNSRKSWHSRSFHLSIFQEQRTTASLSSGHLVHRTGR